ncbi:hypothetical protein [Actinokineospora sp.]|uniref:hypothetical protein n=1 Tax=Actinokineospora sp. TaxID=1872133 RepID=UPI003D6AC269
MPEGNSGEQAPSVDQQVDAQVVVAKVIKVIPPFFGGGADLPVGGGGAGGHYAIASVADLDGLIARWEQRRDKIDDNGKTLDRIIRLIEPPAGDQPSRTQGRRLLRGCGGDLRHSHLSRE